MEIVKADGGHTVEAIGIAAGYARQADTGRTLCYPCANVAERAAMGQADAYGVYPASDGKTLTDWAGGTLARITGHTISRTGFNRSELHRWWATDDDGGHWYGINGGPGMALTVRRIKGTR